MSDEVINLNKVKDKSSSKKTVEKIKIKELNNLLRPEDIDLLNQVEQLSNCESKLINKIKNLNYLENNLDHHIMNQKKILPSNRVSFNKISSFMINWSNKFC